MVLITFPKYFFEFPVPRIPVIEEVKMYQTQLYPINQNISKKVPKFFGSVRKFKGFENSILATLMNACKSVCTCTLILRIFVSFTQSFKSAKMRLFHVPFSFKCRDITCEVLAIYYSMSRCSPHLCLLCLHKNV